ncbi:uncharacterized protein LOC133444500 [Cololabis saira]|uniref:uncharacterized protein LOC133444500 n=1 Tax=Cololabis saira TaxID=129043 RepID=UPI002AD23470|nr:uncharacterized protein LOC133444500 [Cololabis saira]XP_061578328.1 uncharacterized protein LOC133444500 [Cololabis saira]
MMSSLNEAEDTSADPSPQSSTHEEELRKKDTALQKSTREAEDKESEVNEDDEEFSTSLSVGDGRYLVDLGSSSEFIVDEKCLLELFKSCRECSRQCSVRKRVNGLKIIVNQMCHFCENRFQWTNLPDDDDEDEDEDDEKQHSDLQVNGQDTAPSPSMNESTNKSNSCVE